MKDELNNNNLEEEVIIPDDFFLNMGKELVMIIAVMCAGFFIRSIISENFGNFIGF